MINNINSAFEEELYIQYLRSPESVSSQWREYFDKIDGKTIEYINAPQRINYEEAKPAVNNSGKADIPLSANDVLEQMASIPSKIAENMVLSLEVPTATSVREIPVKPLDENRRIINKYLLKVKKNKISFTHLLAWAVVRALVKFPQLNDTFTKINGVANRVRRTSINIGIAIDVTRKDGSRLLMVPSVKDSGNLNFNEFIKKMDELIFKARNNKLELNDLSGATISLTNPGMAGTTHSIPRLMKGQGLIIATGSIDYPVEFQAVSPQALTSLAVSKVVTISNTYDHRIIQGAESAEFLSYINKLLLGEDRFYEQIFASLTVPFEPVVWSIDRANKKLFGGIDTQDIAEKGAHVMLMINSYRVRGHLLSDINPMGYVSYYYPELDPAHYGFTIWDFDRIFHADDSWKNNDMPLRDIIELLRDTYCGKIGYEFMHIQDTEKKEWIKTTLELNQSDKLTKEEQIRILTKLITAEEFENFLHTKFVGHKRFSLEGGESLVVMLDKIINLSADNKLNSIVLGMSHRGRLNVLVNNLNKDIARLFDEFDGYIDSTLYHGSGDVKYHLGYDNSLKSYSGNEIEVNLSPNPSHLELVNPVIEGMARAKANKINDKTYTKILPVVVHGDSAFAGQGIVAETLNLSQLEGYKTGGTIHIIVNNQIGFTTTSEASRSTIYATDIAKTIQAPIIHVNGNDPEAVITATEFAYNYREKFNGDIVIDMLCYRKYGHNEADEPGYTQPLLYKKIKAMKPISDLYSEQLIAGKIVTKDEVIGFTRDIQQIFYDKFSKRQTRNVSAEMTEKPADILKSIYTAISEEDLRMIADKITALPPESEFLPNPKVKALIKKRREMMLASQDAIDWAMAEALAFGSILIGGAEIRISGQDTRRGTFSHRHAVLTDIATEDIYTPLNNIKENQSLLRIFDSPLSEMAVLGFEYGYSLIFKDGLTMWEAQFGDFANNAQTVIDQYITCAETKWGKHSNITLLLPHSYEGQGSEHSSARIERYLQLFAEDNMFVANLSTPAQYFHILRRQIVASYRKPLIIFTPKSLLRNTLAVSSIKDFTDVSFREILDDTNIIDKSQVKRIILCSGKVYYDLLPALTEQKRNDIAIVRVEQYAPFNEELFKSIISSYKQNCEIVWLQEEPQNQGAWSFLSPLINELISDRKLKYIGRKASAATAGGSYKIHQQQQKEIIDKCLVIGG